MEKVLIAIDDSDGAMKAVNFAARHLTGSPETRLTLLHVLPQLPTMFWDDGHILTGFEATTREEEIKRWETEQKRRMAPVVKAARNLLLENGLPADHLDTLEITDVAEVAESILAAARHGNYQTIILGRRGQSGLSKFLMGSVSNKIVAHGTGMTICVAE